MDATTLATEATRHPEAFDLLRSPELDVKWRSEIDEVGVPSAPPELQRPPSVSGRESPTEGSTTMSTLTPATRLVGARCRLTALFTSCA